MPGEMDPSALRVVTPTSTTTRRRSFSSQKGSEADGAVRGLGLGESAKRVKDAIQIVLTPNAKTPGMCDCLLFVLVPKQRVPMLIPLYNTPHLSFPCTTLPTSHSLVQLSPTSFRISPRFRCPSLPLSHP
jgi:hypothetical protein